MGNKKKRYSIERVPEVTIEVPIEDDPYWKISTIYRDMHRVGKSIDRLERFDARHPQWIADLLGGSPTYYCVLGVHRGATPEEVRKALDRQGDDPFYPVEMIQEALSALSTPASQKEYDELLVLFEHYTMMMPPFEKKELIQVHSENVDAAKKYRRNKDTETLYAEFIFFYVMGMPDLYEIAGLKMDADARTVQQTCPQGSELQTKIYSILSDPFERERYDFMFREFIKVIPLELRNMRERKRPQWSSINRELFEKIVLLILEGDNAAQNYSNHVDSILEVNHDWLQYLPPKQESFFSILGLDPGVVQATDKKDLEGLIRDAYRTLPKTPQVHLAYSALKNKTQREDYLWLYETFSWGHYIRDFINMADEEISKGISEIPSPHKAIRRTITQDWE